MRQVDSSVEASTDSANETVNSNKRVRSYSRLPLNSSFMLQSASWREVSKRQLQSVDDVIEETTHKCKPSKLTVKG